jgi:hypothetical protein
MLVVAIIIAITLWLVILLIITNYSHAEIIGVSLP